MNNTKSVKILLIVVFAFLVVAAAIYFLKPVLFPQNTPTEKTATPVNIQQVIPRDTTVSTDITADVTVWKDYSGSSFSFKYPPEWKLQEAGANNTVLYSPDLLEPPRGTPINVHLDTDTYANVVDKIKRVLTNPQEKDVIVDSLKGVEVSGIYQSPQLGNLKLFVTILDNTSNTIVCEYTEYPQAADYLKVYQDIANSIKV